MPTLVCVPIFVETPGGEGDPIDAALADAREARLTGADLVEFRIDRFFPGAGSGEADDAFTVARLRRLLAESPLPVILTCRPAWEGGDYDGDDADRVALFERLCCDTERPPAYLDVELAAYARSANFRQKINLCVQHPKQLRAVTTRLILSTHDFRGRPADLDRRLLAMYQEPACAIVKVAYRARSLRDNLDLFEILRGAPRPTIALGMGEFGLMSRVLAPRFNAFLTFASLRDRSVTAPGQPTIRDLLDRFRFRSITPRTRVYGVMGWPVSHSLGPLIHNAGFDAVDHDGVYLPLPVAGDPNEPEASFASFKATLGALVDDPRLAFAGASVTLPHKENLARFARERPGWIAGDLAGSANTLALKDGVWTTGNTDAPSVLSLLEDRLGGLAGRRIALVGGGGVARAIAWALVRAGATVILFNRGAERGERLADAVNRPDAAGRVIPTPIDLLPRAAAEAFLNCTPVGMTGGPDPLGLSVPIPAMERIDANTVFFDTVYNPVETPMLRAARERGCRTIDGVEMFVRQAAGQFEMWTGRPAPIALFDRLCREHLATRGGIP
jgi:3-dehydroquinate dehydratase/shikimate dehydrogenase